MPGSQAVLADLVTAPPGTGRAQAAGEVPGSPIQKVAHAHSPQPYAVTARRNRRQHRLRILRDQDYERTARGLFKHLEQAVLRVLSHLVRIVY